MKTLAVLALTIAASLGYAAPIEWTVESGGNGHWYEYVPASGISWLEANAAAQLRQHNGQPGDLATITASLESEFVAVNLGGEWYDSAWLGGFQQSGQAPDAGWQWVTQEAWDYTNWADDQPDDYAGIEDYLSMWGYGAKASRRWKWNDDGNDTGPQYTYGYLVEYVPEPTSVLLFALGGFALNKRRR